MSAGATKRFYAFARAEECEDGFGVMLDEMQLKSPMGSIFVTPTRALAEICADEWAAQGDIVSPHAMPVTKLAFAAIDLAMLHGRTLVEHVAKYAETDLVCHRAEAPGILVQRQKAVWDPICRWAEHDLGVRLPVVTGIIAAEASPDIALLRLRADALDDFRLTALAHAVSLAGSALIGFALMEGRLGAEGAFNAAALDEIWSQEMWGLDKEAQARLERMRGEFQALEKFFAALK